MRRLIASLLVAFVSLACPVAAAAVPVTRPPDDQQPAAQQPVPQPPAEEPSKVSQAGVSFLTGYRFHLSAASIRTDDPRFDWDANFGGDIDLLDYGYGRINFLADYEVVLGHEIRHFDPNQGDYNLDVSTSWRVASAELQGFFHHVSRHLGDRANRTSVAWNTLGARAIANYASGPRRATINLRAARIMQEAFVDYTWQIGGGGDLQYRLSPRCAIVGRADLELTAVDPGVAGRGSQVGGRVEAAIRIYGTGAGVEAFVGVERRVDPYPLERETRTWPILGFRFLSR